MAGNREGLAPHWTARLLPPHLPARATRTALLAILLLLGISALVGHAAVRVRGYYRKDGTYVRPHYRSAPDGNFQNNYSTKGSTNPYTGQAGTKVTPPTSSRPSGRGREVWVDGYVRSDGTYVRGYWRSVTDASPRPSGRGREVWVDGYFRSDGTYVQGHWRSAPDGDPSNNWTAKGNVNPYTGKPGTEAPPLPASAPALPLTQTTTAPAYDTPAVPPSTLVTARVNGLPLPVVFVQGEAYVPLREFSTALGLSASFDQRGQCYVIAATAPPGGTATLSRPAIMVRCLKCDQLGYVLYSSDSGLQETRCPICGAQGYLLYVSGL